MMSTQTSMTSQIKQKSVEQKQAYEAKVKAQFEQLNAQIDELKAKAKQAKAEAAVKYESALEELYARRDATQLKLEELQQAGEDAWMELQSGFEKAWNELAQSFDNALKKLQ
ncbi:conserved hypothetical protein [Rippkaea orientalis PCC 8801]|uniref:Coiled coil domain-containing protein n=1 Tax=Rippkaea orientalis (strain PCC 8801 / RF-1) TaxID=41431 RepID=B7K5P0_RIPO1|nr:hypothetical protein [Rippkaea orientalis]ACK66773.1 conserved hypothetical protein [Rippkaea orientalis PCC 8801]